MSHSGQLRRVDSGDMSLLSKEGGVTYLGLDGSNDSASHQQPLESEPERRFEALRSSSSPRHAALLKLSLVPSPLKTRNQKQYLNDYTENENHWKNYGSKLSELWEAPEICRDETIPSAGDVPKLTIQANKKQHKPPAAPLPIIPNNFDHLGSLQKSVLASRRNRWHTSGVICINEPRDEKVNADKATVAKRLKAMVVTLEDALLKKAQVKDIKNKGRPSPLPFENANARGSRTSKRYVACPSELIITPQPTHFVRTPYRYDNDPTHNAGNNVLYRQLGNSNNSTYLKEAPHKEGNKDEVARYVPVKAYYDYNSRKVPSVTKNDNGEGQSTSLESLTHALQTIIKTTKEHLFGDKDSKPNAASDQASEVPSTVQPIADYQGPHIPSVSSKPKYISHPENKFIVEQPINIHTKNGTFQQREIPVPVVLGEDKMNVSAPTLTDSSEPERIGRHGNIVAYADDGAPEEHLASPQVNVVTVISIEPLAGKIPTLMSTARQGFGIRKAATPQTNVFNTSETRANKLDTFRFPAGEENKENMRCPTRDIQSPNGNGELDFTANNNKKSFRDQRRNGIVGNDALAKAFRTK